MEKVLSFFLSVLKNVNLSHTTKKIFLLIFAFLLISIYYHTKSIIPIIIEIINFLTLSFFIYLYLSFIIDDLSRKIIDDYGEPLKIIISKVTYFILILFALIDILSFKFYDESIIEIFIKILPISKDY